MPEPIIEKKELTVNLVETWIKEVATGDFHYTKILDGNIKKEAYAKLREYVARCCKKGLCEPSGKRDGVYRRIEELPQPVDWQSANPKMDFPIDLPFDLRRYVWIDMDTEIAVAGSKDSGKTGFLMRTVAMNMYNINTIFLSNMEGGVNQIKRRFDAMDIEIPTPAPFKMYSVFDHFHDAMKESDTLYVIDYIDVPESGEFFLIPVYMSKIQAKLKNSCAVIGLQKRVNSNWAYGGEQTLKKAALYLSMDKGKIKIVSAKVPAIPTLNPTNMQWSYRLTNEGTKFIDITPLKTAEEIDF